MKTELEAAMWAGDVDRLQELAPCGCCCWEHTSEHCPARAWEGCRGSGNVREDEDAWAEHSRRHHGLTRDQFFGVDT